MPIGLSAGAVAAIGAGVSAAGSVAGSLISSSAAGSAAGKQNAASYASLVASQQQEANGQDLANPFIGYGTAANANNYAAATNLSGQAQPYLNALSGAVPGNMSEADIESTPGYAFDLSQGLKSTQNAAAARGLGVSGAALKGAATYATGLADNTYNTRFNQQQTQYSDASNNLTSFLNTQNQQFNQNNALAQVGANVLTNTNNQNLSYATGNSANITSNGNAQGAASIAQGNALASGVSGVANAATGYANNQLVQNYLNGINGSQYAATNWDDETQ